VQASLRENNNSFAGNFRRRALVIREGSLKCTLRMHRAEFSPFLLSIDELWSSVRVDASMVGSMFCRASRHFLPGGREQSNRLKAGLHRGGLGLRQLTYKRRRCM